LAEINEGLTLEINKWGVGVRKYNRGMALGINVVRVWFLEGENLI